MPPYFSFLLRLWQAGSDAQPLWRASLEDPHTHHLAGFESLESLCAFLQARNFCQLPGPTLVPPEENLPPDSTTPD